VPPTRTAGCCCCGLGLRPGRPGVLNPDGIAGIGPPGGGVAKGGTIGAAVMACGGGNPLFMPIGGAGGQDAPAS
jgi:hypothetical protein